MPGQKKGSREWRVTLAVKWAYLDHLTVPEIKDRFEDELGIELAESTIRDYLDEQEAQEVEELIREEHANTRLQIAEREEQLYRRAREAEFVAVEDQPIVRVVPKTGRVAADRESPMRWPAWEQVDPGDDDWPEWAEERDIIIRFLDYQIELQPGEAYPLRQVDGSPRYTKEFDGLERDQPDLQGRAMARQEQSSHLQAKGEVLGVYTDHIELDGDLTVDGTRTVELGEDEREIARELIRKRQEQAAGGDGDE